MVRIGEKDYLKPDELVERWAGRITEGTLANWRSQDKGPKHVILGGVLYPVEIVEKYEIENFLPSD